MAYSLTSERPAVAARSTTVFSAFLTWLGAARAKRNQRVALAALLNYDESQLDDLGVSRQDVVEAIRHPGSSGAHLQGRRASRASRAVTAVSRRDFP